MKKQSFPLLTDKWAQSATIILFSCSELRKVYFYYKMIAFFFKKVLNYKIYLTAILGRKHFSLLNYDIYTF